jgi:hypothetical protein
MRIAWEARKGIGDMGAGNPICEGNGLKGIHRVVRFVELATVPRWDWQRVCAPGVHNLEPNHTGTCGFGRRSTLDGVIEPP